MAALSPAKPKLLVEKGLRGSGYYNTKAAMNINNQYFISQLIVPPIIKGNKVENKGSSSTVDSLLLQWQRWT